MKKGCFTVRVVAIHTAIALFPSIKGLYIPVVPYLGLQLALRSSKRNSLTEARPLSGANLLPPPKGRKSE